jgi:hypothetical protein
VSLSPRRAGAREHRPPRSPDSCVPGLPLRRREDVADDRMTTTHPNAWTKDRIERFLAEEKPHYQRIELPFGLSTGGDDRGATAKLALPERMDGMSVLDIGCFLGFFGHESFRRGAKRVVGYDINGERLRQARTIAEILGHPIEFHRRDMEFCDPPGVFDVVLCLNVLHHLRNPFAALDRLVEWTRDRLVLEVAGFENPGVWDELKKKRSLRWLGREELSRFPLVYVGAGHSKHERHGKEPWFFTPTAIAHALLGQRRTVARVDLLPSPHHDRFLAIAHKRRIDDLMLVAGLPTTGKTTLISRLVRGELPEIGRALGVERSKDWLLMAARLLRDHDVPHVPAMAFHYDLTRGGALKFGSFSRDLNLDVVRCAQRTRMALLWVDPQVLIERTRKRAAGEAGPRMTKIREGHAELVADAKRSSALLSDWHAWCADTGKDLVYVDTTAEPRLLTKEEFGARVAAAGWRIDAPSETV